MHFQWKLWMASSRWRWGLQGWFSNMLKEIWWRREWTMEGGSSIIDVAGENVEVKDWSTFCFRVTETTLNGHSAGTVLATGLKIWDGFQPAWKIHPVTGRRVIYPRKRAVLCQSPKFIISGFCPFSTGTGRFLCFVGPCPVVRCTSEGARVHLTTGKVGTNVVLPDVMVYLWFFLRNLSGRVIWVVHCWSS